MTTHKNNEPCVTGHPGAPASGVPCCEGCACTCGTDFAYPCECHDAAPRRVDVALRFSVEVKGGLTAREVAERFIADGVHTTDIAAGDESWAIIGRTVVLLKATEVPGV